MFGAPTAASISPSLSDMRIHKIIERTRAEGPGERFCIWVQGCKRHCPGCFNPETWDPNAGEEMGLAEIVYRMLRAKDIEGITLLGGEPMEQAEELSLLARAARDRGLSVLCFTGYTIEEIQNSGDEYMLSLLSETDLLIDGPFIEAQKDLSRPWLGSKNQRYHFLTDRYGPEDVKEPNRLELRIEPDGSLTINGMADDLKLQALKNCLEAYKNER